MTVISAGTAAPALADDPSRWGGRIGLPEVLPRLPIATDVVEHLVLPDGRLGARVALCGKYGEGQTMLLDAADWALVRLIYGPRWLVQGRDGRRNVIGTTRKARGVPLAQVVVGAGKGESVTFLDGNRLNLTRSNLVRHWVSEGSPG